MNASKENAQKALNAVSGCLTGSANAATLIREFLEAAKRKLPTEAAFKRDKQRRKEKAGAK